MRYLAEVRVQLPSYGYCTVQYGTDLYSCLYGHNYCCNYRVCNDAAGWTTIQSACVILKAMFRPVRPLPPWVGGDVGWLDLLRVFDRLWLVKESRLAIITGVGPQVGQHGWHHVRLGMSHDWSRCAIDWEETWDVYRDGTGYDGHVLLQPLSTVRQAALMLRRGSHTADMAERTKIEVSQHGLRKLKL